MFERYADQLGVLLGISACQHEWLAMTKRAPGRVHRWVHRAVIIGGLVVFVVALVALFQGCTAAVHVP